MSMPELMPVSERPQRFDVFTGVAVPEVRAVRHRLVPGWSVASRRAGEVGEKLTLGVADAVALGDDGRVDLVVDWKSEVAPATEAVARYRGQVRAYLDATGAPAELIVFVSSGRTVRVGDTVGGGTERFDAHRGRDASF